MLRAVVNWLPGVVCLALLGAGCSMFDDDNRRLLGWLDQECTPDSTAGKLALAPLALPAGVAAFAADATVVHPVACADDAWLDTVDLLWRPKDETVLRRVLMTPLAALATPFVFAGDLLARWTLPLPERRKEAGG